MPIYRQIKTYNFLFVYLVVGLNINVERMRKRSKAENKQTEENGWKVHGLYK